MTELSLTIPPDRPCRWSPKPAPEQWGTCVGAWGDCLIDYGVWRNLIGEGGILYWGVDPGVADFLRLQRGVREVVHVQPADFREYRRLCEYVAETPIEADRNPASRLAEFAQRVGVEIAGDIVNTSMGIAKPWMSRPMRWHGARLPRSAWAWANAVASDIGGRFVVLNPISLNSTSPDAHWQEWETALTYLLTYTPHTYVAVGQGWRLTGDHPRLVNLVDRSPDMMCVFALAEMSAGVVTTANSLSHYCAVQSIPACVVGNRPLSDRDSHFRKWLDVPNIELVMYEDDLGEFIRAITKVIV